MCTDSSGRPLMIKVIIIHLTHANVWESIGKPSSCIQFIKSHIFYYKSRENPYQVLQVMWESVSDTASHMHCIWTCNKIEGSYAKIIITIVPSYTGTNITRLSPLALLLVLHTCNNTDGNKLVIFFGTALYYTHWDTWKRYSLVPLGTYIMNESLVH